MMVGPTLAIVALGLIAQLYLRDILRELRRLNATVERIEESRNG